MLQYARKHNTLSRSRHSSYSLFLAPLTSLSRLTLSRTNISTPSPNSLVPLSTNSPHSSLLTLDHHPNFSRKSLAPFSYTTPLPTLSLRPYHNLSPYTPSHLHSFTLLPRTPSPNSLTQNHLQHSHLLSPIPHLTFSRQHLAPLPKPFSSLFHTKLLPNHYTPLSGPTLSSYSLTLLSNQLFRPIYSHQSLSPYLTLSIFSFTF